MIDFELPGGAFGNFLDRLRRWFPRFQLIGLIKIGSRLLTHMVRIGVKTRHEVHLSSCVLAPFEGAAIAPPPLFRAIIRQGLHANTTGLHRLIARQEVVPALLHVAIEHRGAFWLTCLAIFQYAEGLPSASNTALIVTGLWAILLLVQGIGSLKVGKVYFAVTASVKIARGVLGWMQQIGELSRLAKVLAGGIAALAVAEIGAQAVIDIVAIATSDL